MGITDKVSGRVKKAAGDLTGDAQLQRQGAQEERKGEAREELRSAEAKADAKREEVDRLELSTNPDELANRHTREELDAMAAERGVTGRSDMTKDDLAREIAARA
jgi:uncharacterized protein YjbJ (UPF0337 family)